MAGVETAIKMLPMMLHLKAFGLNLQLAVYEVPFYGVQELTFVTAFNMQCTFNIGNIVSVHLNIFNGKYRLMDR